MGRAYASGACRGASSCDEEVVVGTCCSIHEVVEEEGACPEKEVVVPRDGVEESASAPCAADDAAEAHASSRRTVEDATVEEVEEVAAGWEGTYCTVVLY